MLLPPKIIIAGQDAAEEVWTRDIEREPPKITHIISIRETAGRNMVPKNLDRHPAKQLRLLIDDIPFDLTSEENNGCQPIKSCTRYQVRQLVRFARRAPENAVTVIHCAAGISRSPAAALIFLATRLGPGKEEEAVQHLRDLRDCFPNPRMVCLGDEVLGRDGRLFRVFRDAFWSDKFRDWDTTFPASRLWA